MWMGGLEVRVLCPMRDRYFTTGGPQDDWSLRVQPVSEPADLRHLLRGDELLAPVGQACSSPPPHMAIPVSKRDEVLGAIFLKP